MGAQSLDFPTGRAGTPSVPSVERSLAILEMISKARSGLTLPELSRRLGLPKSSTHCLLLTLERCGYLTRSGRSHRYMFGLKLFSLANMAIYGIRLRDQARPVLEALALQTRLTVHMAIPDHDEALIIEKIEPLGGVLQQATWLGKRLDLHCSAVGKALLAYLPEKELKDWVTNRRLPRHNDNTITSIRRLQQDLAETKRRGYSVESEEDEIGMCCIGAPVLDESGEAIAAVSVAGTTEQIKLEDISALGKLVGEKAAEIGAAVRPQTHFQRSSA
jgi:DNA-binding IclR family transcriptional regulator